MGKKNRNKGKKNGQNLIERKLYEQIRRMDHQEMSSFYEGVYSKGFYAGAEEASKVDTTIEVLEKLKKVPGFGDKTLAKIKQVLMEDNVAEGTQK